jgi:hypothetical protein
VSIEGEHISYYFQDTGYVSYYFRKYIETHEAAYVKINETFQAVLPHKMIFYVWNDRNLLKQLSGYELGFTNSEICTTNAIFSQTVGHEMTHTLSYWGWGKPTEKMTRLINEGVAVAFDQSEYDKYASARKALAAVTLRVITGDHSCEIHSVLDLWANDNADEKLLYPMGGALLTFLYEKSTPEQFRRLIKNQTIESARQIYGNKEFDGLISDFDLFIGLK